MLPEKKICFFSSNGFPFRLRPLIRLAIHEKNISRWIFRYWQPLVFFFIFNENAAGEFWSNKHNSGTHVINLLHSSLTTSLFSEFRLVRESLNYLFFLEYTQWHCILSYDNSTEMYKFLVTLHPGGIRTRDLLFCRRTRWPLCHAAWAVERKWRKEKKNLRRAFKCSKFALTILCGKMLSSGSSQTIGRILSCCRRNHWLNPSLGIRHSFRVEMQARSCVNAIDFWSRNQGDQIQGIQISPPPKNVPQWIKPTFLTGWPDWAHFRFMGRLFTLGSFLKITEVDHIFGRIFAYLGDCLLWAVFWKITEAAHCYFFPCTCRFCINFDKKWVGLHFGRFFTNSSPCSESTLWFSLPVCSEASFFNKNSLPETNFDP
jgi:hypothetical protein